MNLLGHRPSLLKLLMSQSLRTDKPSKEGAATCHNVFCCCPTGLKPRPVKSMAVLGGGLMGSGIATASLMAGMSVVIKEVNQKFLDVSAVHLCLQNPVVLPQMDWNLLNARDE